MADREGTIPLVAMENGILRGRTHDGVHAFFGIPYAAAPTGINRWNAPQPAEAWDGTRDATAFGPRCPQTVGASFDSRVEEESEDCLFLNLWTARLGPAARRPVIIWIHGGGNLGGAGSEDATDGQNLAQQGVVLVSFNYRLGAFGFLAHASIGSNFAVLDQIAVLGWVRRNIAAFGGDPDNVTVMGQSAGAQAVRVLLSCPSADGLYHRAILQSAGFEAPAFAEGWSTNRAHAAAEELFASLGSNDLEALRLVPAQELKRVSHELSGVISKPGKVHTPANLVWMPVPDSDLFTRTSPAEWPIAVPVLMGYTANEARYFLEPNAPVSREVLERMAGTLCGLRTEEVLDALDRQSGTTYESMAELFSASIWTEPAYATLRQLAEHGHTVFFYIFARNSPGALETRELAKHTAEIRYVFGNLQPPVAYDEVDAELSRAMQRAWIAFAHSGVPANDEGQPWPVYTPDSGVMTHIGDRIESEPMKVSSVVELLSTLRLPATNQPRPS